MRRRIVLFLLAIFMVAFLIGCSTTQFERVYPHSASVSFPAEGPYKILGRVDYESSQGNSGYMAFLEHVKSVYPSADDVVNIVVDSTDTYEVSSKFFGLMGGDSRTLVNSVYTMSGIAIEYLEE